MSSVDRYRIASTTYLVYMNPPPFALHMGERIAIVITTSSGLLRSRAATPLEEPDMWDISCLTRSIAMTNTTKWERRGGSEASEGRGKVQEDSVQEANVGQLDVLGRCERVEDDMSPPDV